MKLKEVFKETLRDRSFLIVWGILLIATLAFIVLASLRVSPSELQIPIRYSSFGVTNFYRDNWLYLLNFVIFGGVMFAVHSLLALKLYAIKGRQLALPFLWLGVGVFIIAYFIVFALFRVVTDIT